MKFKFLFKSIFFVLLAFNLTISAATPPKTVLDYYHLLPKPYRNYYGDFVGEQLKVDIRNGYVVVKVDGWNEPVFEMALFRDAQGEALFVVTNLQYDHVCIFYKSYALRYQDGKWLETDALPQLEPKDFFTQKEDIAVLQKVPNYYSLHYRPPHYGTELKVSFGELCDVVDEVLNTEDYARFINLKTDKVHHLRWNRKRGVFTK